MAVNDAGDSEVEMRLSVMVPPVIDKVGIEGSSQVVINQTAKIFCEARGSPTPEITWLKNGQPLSAANSGAYRVSSQGQLLEIMRVQGNATYSCVARNDAGIAEEEVRLDVLVPPGIEKSSTDKEVETIIGKPVRITCTVTGHPPPEVTWLKNGHLIQPSQHIQFLEKGHVLLLDSPLETDTAEYTCIATNEAGTTEEGFKLNVLIPPTLLDDSLLHVPVIVNRPVRLDCPARGVPPQKLVGLKM
ncbi:fasciclin-2-like, partial [Tachypleus tridentatus]|uniref:fasciclin-2-like n=1 Tax=Tachypleus tridentatus TaxID=6853 RepID=UPI003FD262F9